MKITSFRPWLVALAVSLSMAVSVHAGSTALLQQAYGELASADHDYKGHRAAAMKKLEEAGKMLGTHLRGNTRDHEKQGLSDDHLKAAQGLLQQAASGLTGKPLKRVRSAEKDISIALHTK